MDYLTQREGMDTVRTDQNTIKKVAKDEANAQGLKNAWRFLMALKGSGLAPEPIALTENSLEMEYIQADAGPPDQESLRQNSIRLVFELRKRHIIHGDLTKYNIIIRNGWPVAIDWDQSNFSWEPKPQKRPKPDTVHILNAVAELTGDTNRVIRRYLAIRPHMEYYMGWGRLLDLGTFQGDYPFMAQAEFIQSHGVDYGGFNTAGIQVAREWWGQYGCTFEENDISKMTEFKSDITLLFSTWSYLVRDYGKEVALSVLPKIIADCEVLFFENQLYGDGPGPEFLKEDSDIYAMLSRYAANVVPLVTIQVTGRDAKRTVWKVTK